MTSSLSTHYGVFPLATYLATVIFRYVVTIGHLILRPGDEQLAPIAGPAHATTRHFPERPDRMRVVVGANDGTAQTFGEARFDKNGVLTCRTNAAFAGGLR
jgi:hypothetical protein